jgi:hypothetical protein
MMRGGEQGARRTKAPDRRARAACVEVFACRHPYPPPPVHPHRSSQSRTHQWHAVLWCGGVILPGRAPRPVLCASETNAVQKHTTATAAPKLLGWTHASSPPRREGGLETTRTRLQNISQAASTWDTLPGPGWRPLTSLRSCHVLSAPAHLVLTFLVPAWFLASIRNAGSGGAGSPDAPLPTVATPTPARECNPTASPRSAHSATKPVLLRVLRV